MGKIIRRTVTITTTETWTIVWLTEDEPQHQAPRLVQERPKTQEEPDELFQATLTTTKPDQSSASAALPLSPTPAVSLDPQSDGVSTRSTAGRQRKRSRSRRAADNP